MLKFFLWSIVSGFLGGFKQPELFTWFWVGLIGGGLAYLIRNCDDRWPECWWEESWLEILTTSALPVKLACLTG